MGMNIFHRFCFKFFNTNSNSRRKRVRRRSRDKCLLDDHYSSSSSSTSRKKARLGFDFDFDFAFTPSCASAPITMSDIGKTVIPDSAAASSSSLFSQERPNSYSNSTPPVAPLKRGVVGPPGKQRKQRPQGKKNQDYSPVVAVCEGWDHASLNNDLNQNLSNGFYDAFTLEEYKRTVACCEHASHGSSSNSSLVDPWNGRDLQLLQQPEVVEIPDSPSMSYLTDVVEIQDMPSSSLTKQKEVSESDVIVVDHVFQSDDESKTPDFSGVESHFKKLSVNALSRPSSAQIQRGLEIRLEEAKRAAFRLLRRPIFTQKARKKEEELHQDKPLEDELHPDKPSEDGLSITIVKQAEGAKRYQVALQDAFSPLSNKDEVAISKAFRGSQREVLLLHEESNIEITREKICCLLPSAWLNDEVINLYLELLKERENRDPTKYLKCHFFNTFFYKKLFNSAKNIYDYKAVRRWTTKKKIGYHLSDCEKIFIPIHKEIHWCLGIIDIKEKKFQYLDSLKGRDQHVMDVLQKYIKDEVKDKTGMDLDVSDWDKEFPVDIPGQLNGYDCGMFMIKYMDFYSRGLPLCFSQDNMSYFRKRTALEILRSRAD